MAATYLKGSFLRAVCNHLRANIPPSPFYVLMINPFEEEEEKKKEGCRGRRSKKSLKLMSICLPRIHFLFRDNFGLILM
jgi:hypothetical protein